MSSGALAHEKPNPLSVPVEDGLGIGHFVELALCLNLIAGDKSFSASNPVSDNLPLLLRLAGVVDGGNYLKRWSSRIPQSIQGQYRNIKQYDLLTSGSDTPLKTPALMGRLGVILRNHAATRELLIVFIQNRTDIEPLFKLRKKFRLIALNADIYHLHGAAVLSMERGKLTLSEITYRGQEMWHPSDMFLVRSQSPS